MDQEKGSYKSPLFSMLVGRAIRTNDIWLKLIAPVKKCHFNDKIF